MSEQKASHEDDIYIIDSLSLSCIPYSIFCLVHCIERSVNLGGICLWSYGCCKFRPNHLAQSSCAPLVFSATVQPSALTCHTMVPLYRPLGAKQPFHTHTLAAPSGSSLQICIHIRL